MGTGGLFDAFAQATTFRQILQYFNQMCLVHDIDPNDYRNLFPRLRDIDKGCENSKAQKLFALTEKRYNHPVYAHQKAAENLDILIVGAGPCGLRAAIECALLGAHVVVIEQRDKFSRNNVLHLWQFVIQDLKSLGAKIFFPKFCTGSIDHISIRQLQCILLKVALCLGVQVHDSVSFIDYRKPTVDEDGIAGGWTAVLEPRTHILSTYEFDVLIGADGKRNTVKGFPKDCMRARLAIGITANFRNTHTPAEVIVPEISGVAFIFNQSFFNEMKNQTGVELENIVYYKDETHYFVMSAMKRSLLEKHVLKQDYDEVSLLLAKENIDQEMLCKYATQAADFATKNQLPLNYVTNGRGECDVAMFDFTNVYKAQHSVTLSEAGGRFLLTTIVGDSLYEPFWPTGSGCARGFLGVFDSAWMIRELGLREKPVINVVAERERIYKLLANANKDNMKMAFSKYTIDPTTRYTSSELSSVAGKVCCHLDLENEDCLDDADALNVRNHIPTYMSHSPVNRKLNIWRLCNIILAPKFRVLNFSTQSWGDALPLAALVAKFRKDLVDLAEVGKDVDSNILIATVLNAIESEYGLPMPCEDLKGWATLHDEERYLFIQALLSHLMNDRVSVRQAFSSAPRPSHANNRRRIRVNTSSARKAEPIKRATEMLRSTEAFGNNGPAAAKRSVWEDCLSGTNDGEERVDASRFSEQIGFANEQESKPYTKRPLVDKLDPVKLCRVEQIVSGQLEKDRSEQFHNSRYVSSVSKTRRLDKNDLDEMEQKLEKTGMGVLIDREKFHSMTSKEEKIIRANAADARSFALGGFREDDKFKEIDSRLEKADKLLKNKALSGVNIVSQIKVIQSPKKGKGPPPPTPPKGAQANVVEVPLRQNASEAAPRPASMSAVSDSLYSSVNARRRQPCAICSDEVYLAEQLLVEKKTIHKRCFRCFYCEQPLRLGNYGTDRAITEAYGIRFYCSQHMMLNYREKVARIEKHSKRANRASVAIVQPMSPSFPCCSSNPVSSSSSNVTPLPASEMKVLSSPAPTLEKPPTFAMHNSPDSLKQRTIERIQAIADQPRSCTNVTPERAQFECVHNDSSSPVRSPNEGFLMDSDDEDEELLMTEEEESSADELEYGTPMQNNEATDDSHSSDEETDEFADCEEWLQDSLGDHLREHFEKHPNAEITESDAEKVLNLYNTTIVENLPSTPEGTEPLNDSIYYTTRPYADKSDEDEEGDRRFNLLDSTLTRFEATLSTTANDETPVRPQKEMKPKTVGFSSDYDGHPPTSGGDKSTSIAFADDSSPQRTAIEQNSGFENLLSRLSYAPAKEPSTVTVVPVDPDHTDHVARKMSNINLNGLESHQGTISTGSTTCISILPYDDKSAKTFGSPAARGTVPGAIPRTPLTATPRNIQRIRNEIEKYRSNVEQQFTLLAQDVQRKISETESRLQDVIATGTDLETSLKNKTENRFAFDRWVEYKQEYRMLNLKLEELHIRVKEMQVAREFGEVQRQLDSIRTRSLGAMPIGINEMKTRENASRIIALLDEQKAFHEQRREINKKWEIAKFNPTAEASENGSDVKNFTPFFAHLQLKL